MHIVHRGNNRAPCFFSDEDRAFYLFHLCRLLPRSECQLHAYCLMDNHVHLLLTPATASGSGRLMKGVAQLYAQYINKHFARSGYLWESRYKSCLVQLRITFSRATAISSLIRCARDGPGARTNTAGRATRQTLWAILPRS